MSDRPFHPTLEDLPDVLPIFPLPGVLLIPEGRLPLNVFEPRYLAMVEDVLGQPGRLVGMIQPRAGGAGLLEPMLYGVGCAGRISSFDETDDGRILMTLTGVCRFRVAGEEEGQRGYRRIRPDWRAYAADLDDHTAVTTLDRKRLTTVLRPYLKMCGIELDWQALESASDHDLAVMLPMICPPTPYPLLPMLTPPTNDVKEKVGPGNICCKA